MDTIIASVTLKRTVADGYLVATAQLHQLSGNSRPYFSVTGELWDSEGWYRRGQDGRCREVGPLHERIGRAFPQLRPVIALHLADDTGEPMHALANGWHFYSGGAHEYERSSRYYAAPTDTPHERAARSLRVDPSELPEGLDQAGFAEYVDSLRPRWEAEASTALATIHALS